MQLESTLNNKTGKTVMTREFSLMKREDSILMNHPHLNIGEIHPHGNM